MWRGQASGREGAEAHSGPMTHPFAGFGQRGRGGGGQHNSINRRTPMFITCRAPVRSWSSKAFECLFG